MSLAAARLFDHVFLAGVAAREIDVDTLVRLVRDRQRPSHPLGPRPLGLSALSWALSSWPAEVTGGVLWLSGEHHGITRIGPREWVLGASLTEARDLATAATILSSSSLTLRECLFSNPLLDELQSPSVIEPLSLRLGVSAEALAQACAAKPDFLAHLGVLTRQAFSIRLRVGELPVVSARARGLWQEVLSVLAEVGADARPLYVWVSPLWVTDLVSPYSRDVRPLVERWARQSGALPELAERIAKGDPDATYLSAQLFVDSDPRVREEKEVAESQCGIYAICDPSGVTAARIVDTALLDAARDSRLPEAELLRPAPLVLVLAEHDPDIGHAFGRLLCDVSAPFARVWVCAQATGVTTPRVATALAVETLHGAMVMAAPAQHLVAVPLLAVPSRAMALALGIEAAEDEPMVCAHALQQEPLAETLLRGDWAGGPIEQHLWIDCGGSVLDERRAHSEDALAIWRTILGIGVKTDNAPPEPIKPAAPTRPWVRV